jgi:hypothetical protein
MNRIATFALFVASTFIAVANASAQNQVKVNVPFSFTVGDSTMPAGSYTIKSDPGSRNLVQLTNWGQQARSIALAIPEQGDTRVTDKLVFHKIGDQYFLSEIRCERASMNVQFPVTKAEKRVKAQVQTAGLRVDNGVMIALNK